MEEEDLITTGKTRYTLPDSIRGITLISMILYHAMWDLVFLYEVKASWYLSDFAYVWQQSICWTFILLSGFCWSLGRNKWKRGLIVSGAGILITMVTCIIMPENRVIFGVLTFIGFCMLVMIPIEKLLKKVEAKTGLLLSSILFFFTRNVNYGTIGFEKIKICNLPNEWYHDLLTAFLGFPEGSFFSTDYFSVFPWIFLYISGYFIFRILQKANKMEICSAFSGSIILKWIGKHSLLIYVIHQPIIFSVLALIFKICR